ncbi:hypothetical protein FB451DRAFT_1568452 [Mycena latifolia]|nr:hypothetical protein FB451DRAFT_1568452 [Mycena latifolia]
MIASTSTRAGAPTSAIMPHPLTQPRPAVATRTTRGRAPPVSTTGIGPARILLLGTREDHHIGVFHRRSRLHRARRHHTSAQAPHRLRLRAQPGRRTAHHASRVRNDVVASSSSTSASAAVEADLLPAQAELAGATAQLVNAQAKKVELEDGRVAAGSSQAVRPSAPRATCAGVLPHVSRRLVCPWTTPRRGTSPHSHSYFYIRLRPPLTQYMPANGPFPPCPCPRECEIAPCELHTASSDAPRSSSPLIFAQQVLACPALPPHLVYY